MRQLEVSVVELPENYQNLVSAIIMRAVKDYRRALRTLRRDPAHAVSKYQKDEIERFFRSQWFKDICDLRGEELIEQLQKEVVCA